MVRHCVRAYPRFVCMLSCLLKAPVSRKPSKEQEQVSAALVEAMAIREGAMDSGGVRAGLALNPVRQGIDG